MLTETKLRVRSRVIEASRGRRGLARVRAAALPVDASRVDTWRAWMAFWPEKYGASSDSCFADGYREWRGLIAGRLPRRRLMGSCRLG